MFEEGVGVGGEAGLQLLQSGKTGGCSKEGLIDGPFAGQEAVASFDEPDVVESELALKELFGELSGKEGT